MSDSLSSTPWATLLPWLEDYRDGPPLLADDELIVNAWIDSTPTRTLTAANTDTFCSRIAERFLADRSAQTLASAFPFCRTASLHDVDFSGATVKALTHNEIRDTSTLTEHSADSLLTLPRIGPAVINQVLTTLIRLSAETISAPAVNSSESMTEFVNDLTGRDRLVLVERILSDRPRTQTELAAQIGSSRERVTQLDRSIRRKLEDLVAQDYSLDLLRSDILSRAQPLVAVDEFLASHPTAARPVPALDVATWRIVCAGISGITASEGWILRGTLREVTAQTHAIVTAAATPEGTSPLSQVAIELGLPLSDAAKWLRRTGFAILSGHAISASASTGDLVAAVLGIADAALTFADITAALGEFPRADSSLRNALVADDRIIKTDRNHYGLARWGVERYVPVHRQIGALLDAAGGTASIDEIASAIRAKYAVSEASIRAYASSGEFETRGHSVTRRARPYRPRKSPTSTRALYRDNHVVHWQTSITAAHVKGAAFNIPSALAGIIGVGPGSPVTLDSPLGPQQFTWASVQARSGSIKRFVTEIPLVQGDPVFIDFGPGTFDIRLASPMSDRSVASQILALLGRTSKDLGRRELTSVLREALWLPPDATVDVILSTLEHRKESVLAQLVRAAAS
ncbi:sigma factor-like helix-turn-helix DNA-binding protein [Gordonia sp. CPCC 205333]|uniref:sigma factor-like helix-turn-helix DNA-binding protein n=1 Tax=Gordonia sp. CPCC 205333 TaxID=3140790 RepID=UPI003AF38B55